MPEEARQGVGKNHNNRRPRYGPRCSWLAKVDEIVYRIEQTSEQWFDRQSIEHFFGLQKHSALRLMRQMGAGARAKDRLIGRRDLLIWINQVAQSEEFFAEASRRERLAGKLGAAAATLSSRQVVIALPSPAADSIAGLPANIKLCPGVLVINFNGTEELLRTLFEISQVAARDFIGFQKRCEG